MSRIKKAAAALTALLLLGTQVSCRDIRVVSLAPSITEILFSLGLTENEIVGITDYCNYPQEARRIAKIGSVTTVNIEKVISLKPDYVFSAGSRTSSLNAGIKNAGLNIEVFDPQDLNDIFLTILQIGQRVNRRAEAQILVKDLRRRLRQVRAKVKAIKQRKNVYIEIWADPITSAGKGSLVDEVIREAGGINIAGDINILYPTVSQEFVISRNPDVIILGYMATYQRGLKKAVSDRLGWQKINAVRAGDIICDINPDIFLRPGPRILDGIEQIQERLYGE